MPRLFHNPDDSGNAPLMAAPQTVHAPHCQCAAVQSTFTLGLTHLIVCDGMRSSSLRLDVVHGRVKFLARQKTIVIRVGLVKMPGYTAKTGGFFAADLAVMVGIHKVEGPLQIARRITRRCCGCLGCRRSRFRSRCWRASRMGAAHDEQGTSSTEAEKHSPCLH